MANLEKLGICPTLAARIITYLLSLSILDNVTALPFDTLVPISDSDLESQRPADSPEKPQ